MLRNFVAYNDAAVSAVGGEKGGSGDGDLTFGQVKDKTSDLMFKLSQMKFESPSQGEEVLRKKLDDLHAEIQEKFRQIRE